MVLLKAAQSRQVEELRPKQEPCLLIAGAASPEEGANKGGTRKRDGALDTLSCFPDKDRHGSFQLNELNTENGNQEDS